MGIIPACVCVSAIIDVCVRNTAHCHRTVTKQLSRCDIRGANVVQEGGRHFVSGNLVGWDFFFFFEFHNNSIIIKTQSLGQLRAIVILIICVSIFRNKKEIQINRVHLLNKIRNITCNLVVICNYEYLN